MTAIKTINPKISGAAEFENSSLTIFSGDSLPPFETEITINAAIKTPVILSPTINPDEIRVPRFRASCNFSSITSAEDLWRIFLSIKYPINAPTTNGV